MWQEVLNCRTRHKKGTDSAKKARSRQTSSSSSPPPNLPALRGILCLCRPCLQIGQLHTLAWLYPHPLLPGSRLPVENVAGPEMIGPRDPLPRTLRASPMGSPTFLTGLSKLGLPGRWVGQTSSQSHMTPHSQPSTSPPVCSQKETSDIR